MGVIVSWRKAQAAGARQQADRRARAAYVEESNVHRSIGGKCQMAGCSSPATYRCGNLKVCRECKAEVEKGI